MEPRRIGWLFVFAMLMILFWDASIPGRLFVLAISAALSFALTAIEIGKEARK